MKKILSTLIILSVISTVLVSCGKKHKDPARSAAKTTVSQCDQDVIRIIDGLDDAEDLISTEIEAAKKLGNGEKGKGSKKRINDAGFTEFLEELRNDYSNLVCINNADNKEIKIADIIKEKEDFFANAEKEYGKKIIVDRQH